VNPTEGFPFKFGTSSGGQKLEWSAIRPTGPRRKFDDIICVDAIHERDGRTDGRTPDDNKDRCAVKMSDTN